ncbi:MAG TPA: hypothetical protein PLA94_24285, partial [Myxococcota bacterium]|nr:hypothetical protein [Myxococcota bacterium]
AAMNKLDSVELAAQATFERVLLIERDGASPSAPLLAAFGQAGSPVQVQEGSGLRDLLENPYQAKMDPALAEGIVSWFKNAGPRLSVGPAGGSPELRMTGVTGALAGPGEVARVLERPWLQPGGAGELSGILCLPARPVQPGTPWTIFYNAGGIRRCGPNRLWTGAARALAARGRPSLRIDVRDVGDSDGTSVPHGDLEAMYAESSIDDATAAYDWVEAQSAAAIDVIGLCSGAFLGVQVAARRRVRRALLFNGLALVWNDDARASGMTSQIRGSLLNTRRWKRLLTGRIDAKALGLALLSKGGIAARNVLARVQGAPPPDEVEELLRRVQDRGTTLLLVASEGDPSVAYLERHVRPPYRPAMTTISGVDHTIRPVWAQSRVIGLIVGTPAATG